jgi:Flp pilus assembly pilin Flp
MMTSQEAQMYEGFLKDETGAELAEYAVAVALLVAIALIVYQVLGQGFSDANSQTGSAIKSATFTP